MGVSDREATLFLGTEAHALTVSHVVPASPARTLRALGAVLQQAPYELRLHETLGAHPLDGGVLVFAFTGPIVGASTGTGGSAGESMNLYWLHMQQGLAARQLQVTLRAVPGAPERTEVTVTCDVRPGVRRSVRTSQWIAGTLGSGTGFFTGAILAKGAAVALSLGVLGPAAAVGLATVGASLWTYRWSYPRTVDRARREILGALEAVAAAVQSEAIFGALPGPGRSRRAGGDDGAAALLVVGS
jgi:hypothetical protein